MHAVGAAAAVGGGSGCSGRRWRRLRLQYPGLLPLSLQQSACLLDNFPSALTSAHHIILIESISLLQKNPRVPTARHGAGTSPEPPQRANNVPTSVGQLHLGLHHPRHSTDRLESIGTLLVPRIHRYATAMLWRRLAIGGHGRVRQSSKRHVNAPYTYGDTQTVRDPRHAPQPKRRRCVPPPYAPLPTVSHPPQQPPPRELSSVEAEGGRSEGDW